MAIKNEDKILKYNGLKTLVKNICDNFARISHKHTKSDITDFPTSMPASDVYSWAKQQNKPTYTKSEVGLGNVENKSSATIRGEITKSNVTSALGYTPYTPNEVDNKLSALETNIDWKESVATYDDIATTYPNPDDGWTVNVKDTDYTYRYNGTSWVAISANAIPKATNSVDGLLSKEDHARYDSAKTHADSTHARTDATKVEKSATNGNVKINGTETNVYTHPSGTNPHGTTKGDLGLGNVGNFKAVSTVASQGLSDAEKSNARTNIGAQVAGSYASSSHNHDTAYSKIGHTHDDRYYTESEMNTKLGGKVDLSADGVSNAINQLSIGTSAPNDEDYYVSQYVNGGTTTTSYHRRPMSALWSYIKGKADSTYSVLGHKHTKSEIKDFPTSLPANGGNASTVNGHTVNSDVPTNAKFTDTTYSSKAAASGGTDVSLVTTGEKAIWNAKTSNTGTITGIKMNGASKGTSGVVDLGTVLTSGKQTSTSSADGGSNVYTFSDGSTITVKNGSKGSTGAKGDKGETGATGAPGKDGVTPTIKAASGSSIGSVGTPSVTANTSGTTTTFTFNYLKGAKGDKGDPGVNATTTAVATTSANGLMSSSDKTNHNTMYTALSDEITEAMVNSLF